jgi:glycerol-3-phosphate cytidylyltransferase
MNAKNNKYIYDKTNYISDIYKKNTFSYQTISYIKEIKNKYNSNSKIIGFTCGSFDKLIENNNLIEMLKECKSICDILVVGLHADPSINRSSKSVPIQSLEERIKQLKECNYVDEIIEYNTEDDLLNILIYLKPNIRIIGEEWKNKDYTGCNFNHIQIYYYCERVVSVNK